MPDRLAQVGRRHGVVDHERNARLVRDPGDRLEIADHAVRVRGALDEDRLGPLAQRLLELGGPGRIDEAHPPAELGKSLAELRDRAAIELARRDDLVARLHQVEQRDELGGVAARDRACRRAALERCDALLEHRDRGVGDARVDVAEALQVEQRGGVVDVVEHEGGGLVDRRGARAGGRIGRSTGVDRQGLETVVLLAHLPLLATAPDTTPAALPTGGEGSRKRQGSQTGQRWPRPRPMGAPACPGRDLLI